MEGGATRERETNALNARNALIRWLNKRLDYANAPSSCPLQYVGFVADCLQKPEAAINGKPVTGKNLKKYCRTKKEESLRYLQRLGLDRPTACRLRDGGPKKYRAARPTAAVDPMVDASVTRASSHKRHPAGVGAHAEAGDVTPASSAMEVYPTPLPVAKVARLDGTPSTCALAFSPPSRCLFAPRRQCLRAHRPAAWAATRNHAPAGPSFVVVQAVAVPSADGPPVRQSVTTTSASADASTATEDPGVFAAQLAALLQKFDLQAASAAVRQTLAAIGESEWVCSDCGKSLWRRAFTEEICGDGRSALCCSRCYALDAHAAPAEHVLTVHYAPSEARSTAHAVAVGLPPGPDHSAGRTRLREELDRLCRQYLAIAKAFAGNTSFNGGRYGIFVSHERNKRHKEWLVDWLAKGNAASAKKKRQMIRNELYAVGSSVEQMGELYDRISKTVLDLLEAEHSALEELMLRLRPTAAAAGRRLNTRALEIIIADAGAKDQDTHKDWILAGQAQAQLYVSRAGRATVLQRFEGDAVEEMRRRYGEQHGEEPGTGWDGKANINAELAAIYAADAGQLCTWPLTKGAVPAGQWQAIGEVGATHYGPSTSDVRVILVAVLTYAADNDWSPLQLHGAPSLLQLGDAAGLLTEASKRQCATAYMKDRSVTDGAAFNAFVAGGCTGELPDSAEMYPELRSVIVTHTERRWERLYWHAYRWFVRWHSKEYCDDPHNDLHGRAAELREGGVGMVSRTCASDIRGWKTWAPAWDGQTRPPEQAGTARERDAAATAASESATNETPAVQARREWEVSGLGDWAENYEEDTAGVSSPDGGVRLHYHWDSAEQLEAGKQRAEVFVIRRGWLQIWPRGTGTVFVFNEGDCGEIHAEFDGELICSRDMRKLYTYLDAYGFEVETGSACDKCGRAIGGEYYQHEVRLPETLEECTGKQLAGVAAALELELPKRTWHKTTLLGLLSDAGKENAVRIATARAPDDTTAVALEESSPVPEESTGVTGTAKLVPTQAGSKGKGIVNTDNGGDGAGGGGAGRSCAKNKAGKATAPPIAMSMEDLEGLVTDCGVVLPPRVTDRQTWERLIRKGLAEDRAKTMPTCLERVLCCLCYLTEAPPCAERRRYGRAWPLTEAEGALADKVQRMAAPQQDSDEAQTAVGT